MADLVTIDDLPDDFEYPPEYIRVVELGLTNLEPWWIVQGQLLRDRFQGLQRGYPDRKLILFAVRQDNDDAACWKPGNSLRRSTETSRAQPLLYASTTGSTKRADPGPRRLGRGPTDPSERALRRRIHRATALNHGLPVITSDKALPTVLKSLGVEVRAP